MAQEIFHRGYRIQGTSYQTERGTWIPRAVITPVDEAQNREEAPLAWEEEFDTQTQADSFALQGAQLYIDSNY